ncbi:MAG: 2OG-Fe(II) oxygenase [Gammaproteobacteria bacterium]|nr:2OG-Fe(II) oxygenase [Gammaproteobacteria bacterium]
MDLLKYFERAFDQRRVTRNAIEYDERRGYGAYHAHCRAYSSAGAAATIAAGADDPGMFEFLESLLSPCTARRLLSDATADGKLGLLKSKSRDLQGFRMRDPARVAHLLATVLTSRVDALVRKFFGCEYLVHWFTVAATPPTTRPASVSFHWHCDKGPTKHLKLIVYLNCACEHGGGTAFLDQTDSAAVAASGYLFGRAKKRTCDLSVLAARSGRALSPLELRPASGDAVLFQPSTVVHTGITPTRGTRYALTLCLLPAPLPWHEALRCGTMSDLMEDALWHEDALTLLQKMGLGI